MTTPAVPEFEFDFASLIGSLNDDPIYVEVPTFAPQLVFTGNDAVGVTLLNSVYSRDAAVVELVVRFNDDTWIVHGTSKRMSNDLPDPQVALGLALGRAFESLSRQILRQANGRVQHNDDNREKRKAVVKAKVKAAAKKTKTAAKAKAKA